jgi:hypothetical protein
VSDEPTPPDEAPRKRRPKDSEFFELPPDLKRKMAPGELPAMATSRSKERKAESEPAKEKGGCLGLLVGLVAGGGLLVAALA